MERLAYRVSEAAEAIGVSRTTAYELIAANKLPAIRIGKSFRIPAEALREWVKRQTQSVASGPTGSTERTGV